VCACGYMRAYVHVCVRSARECRFVCMWRCLYVVRVCEFVVSVHVYVCV